MISNNISKLFIFSFIFSVGFCCKAGNITGDVINFHCGESMVNDDKMIAEKEIILKCCGPFRGVGYMEAPDITIIAEKFEYTGTINCGNKCTITVKEQFDAKMFKRGGGGEFIITIDPLLEIDDVGCSAFPKFEIPEFPKFEKTVPRLEASELKFDETRVPRLQAQESKPPEVPKPKRLIKKYKSWITKEKFVATCLTALVLGVGIGVGVVVGLVEDGWNPLCKKGSLFA